MKSYPVPFVFIDQNESTRKKIQTIKDHFNAGKQIRGVIRKIDGNVQDWLSITPDYFIESIEEKDGQIIGHVSPVTELCVTFLKDPTIAISLRSVYVETNDEKREIISTFFETEDISKEGETQLNATFEQIIEALTCGNKITRGKGVIYLVPASSYPKTRNTLSGVKETDEMVKYGPYLACTDQKTGITYPYAFTAEDVLSKDWRSLGFD